MICPKCEEGTIQKIFFKKNQQIGYLCGFCGAVWFGNEEINDKSPHTIQSLTKDGDLEYTFVDIDKNEGDKKSIMYPIFK